MITGHDLVSLGIRIAAGESLPFTQDEIEISGHAIQCRINAEDPVNFVPSPGRLWDCHFPAGFGVRVDTHAHIGYEMPGCFDSLLAKMIVWAPTREDAIAGMKTALDETVLVGVETVIPLHKAIMNEPDYLAQDITIQYIEEHPNLL
jgi:biotin carboxylase